MKLRSLQLLPSIALFISFSFTLLGQGILPQEEQEETPQEQTDTIQKPSFESTEITKAFNESNSLITESGMKHFSEVVISGFMGEVDTLFSTISQFMGDTIVIAVKGVSIRELEFMAQRAGYYHGELEQLLNRLSDKTGGISATTKMLDANKEKWIITLESDHEEGIPEDRLIRINRITHRLDSVKSLLQEDLSRILVQEDRISDKMDALEQLQVIVQNRKTSIGEQLFSRELPGLIKCMSAPGDTALVQKHILQIQKSFKTDKEILISKYRRQLELLAFFLVVFLVFAIWFSKNYTRLISEKQFKLSDIQKTLIHSPVVTVFFTVGLLIRFTLPHLPHTFRALNLVIMMIPMIIIVIRIFGRQIRNWILLLLLLCGLTFFYELTFDPDRLLRMILMVFSLSGLSLFLWMYINRPLQDKYNKKLMYGILRAMLLIFSILLIVSVVANLRGAFHLAEFFTIFSIQIALLAVGVEVATTVAGTLIYLFLASNSMQRVNVIKSDFKYIYKKMVALANLLLWGLFFIIALNIFQIKDDVFEWGERLFTDSIAIGAAEITVGNILIFIFVIWLSIAVAKGIRHILEKDVFPRVKTAKGVPSTVVMFVQIILVSSGFFLAAAAAGIKLTNLSIILGAFSVGIGFGLQNIFNNIVSGLILAVERPIKVGDVVQVGELVGVVKSIGLRSSNVKSFEGAEVIVPNGNLISNEMINWTLSDSSRRLSINVGVAYGTDTDQVIEILQELAINHELVYKKPSPTAYFTRFGDSALEFKLRAWTNIDNRLPVESDLNGAINKALHKAGIEIPFPQTDLHIRSDETKVKPHQTK